MSEEAAHPIWACDDDAIKAEYQHALDEAKKWQDWHARADSEAERLGFERDRLRARVSELREALERIRDDNKCELAHRREKPSDNPCLDLEMPMRCPRCEAVAALTDTRPPEGPGNE